MSTKSDVNSTSGKSRKNKHLGWLVDISQIGWYFPSIKQHLVVAVGWYFYRAMTSRTGLQSIQSFVTQCLGRRCQAVRFPMAMAEDTGKWRSTKLWTVDEGIAIHHDDAWCGSFSYWHQLPASMLMHFDHQLVVIRSLARLPRTWETDQWGCSLLIGQPERKWRSENNHPIISNRLHKLEHGYPELGL